MCLINVGDLTRSLELNAVCRKLITLKEDIFRMIKNLGKIFAREEFSREFHTSANSRKTKFHMLTFF